MIQLPETIRATDVIDERLIVVGSDHIYEVFQDENGKPCYKEIASILSGTQESKD